MAGSELTRMQNIGILVFVALCGLPAMQMNGFGFGPPIPLPLALLLSIIGGAVGGALICSRPIVAGLVGGLIAGPIGLLAVYFYTMQREQVWTLELVVVQGIGCLPGVGVGVLLQKMLGSAAAPISSVSSTRIP